MTINTYRLQEDICREDVHNLAFFAKTKPNMFIVPSILHEYSSHSSSDSEARILGFRKP